MSTKNNKPQWMLDLDKEIQEFNQTKYAKLTDAELSRLSALEDWNASEEAQKVRSKNGIKVGGSEEGKERMRQIQKIGAPLGGQAGGAKAFQAAVENGTAENWWKAGTEAAVEYYNSLSEEQKTEKMSKMWEATKKKADENYWRYVAIYNELPEFYTTKEFDTLCAKYGRTRTMVRQIHEKNGWRKKLKRGHYQKL